MKKSDFEKINPTFFENAYFFQKCRDFTKDFLISLIGNP